MARGIWLLDSTGREWWSDPAPEAELTDEAVGEMEEALGDLSQIKRMALTRDGVTYHFNPRHVVAWAIREREN